MGWHECIYLGTSTSGKAYKLSHVEAGEFFIPVGATRLEPRDPVMRETIRVYVSQRWEQEKGLTPAPPQREIIPVAATKAKKDEHALVLVTIRNYLKALDKHPSTPMDVIWLLGLINNALDPQLEVHHVKSE